MSPTPAEQTIAREYPVGCPLDGDDLEVVEQTVDDAYRGEDLGELRRRWSGGQRRTARWSRATGKGGAASNAPCIVSGLNDPGPQLGEFV